MKAILDHEGGLTNDPKDPGGITNWGISLRFLTQEDSEDHPTAETIKEMTKAEAEDIYREFWWDRYHYVNFNQLIVVEKVFDLAVNMGGLVAHKLLQLAINRLIKEPIIVDGLLGQHTFAQANSLDGNALREGLRECAEHRYIKIVADNPAMEWALKGWLTRAAW
jgi:lysozyme family protein